MIEKIFTIFELGGLQGKGKGIDSCYSARLYLRFLWHHVASFGKKKDDQTSKMMTLGARSHESGYKLDWNTGHYVVS